MAASAALDPGVVHAHGSDSRGTALPTPARVAAQFASSEAGSLGDFADPFVFRDGDVYFAVATNGNGRHVQIARSQDLQSWKRLPDALPQLPAWASDEHSLTWAPSVLKRMDQWILYYTTRDRRSGFQCISRAVSHRPSGPYVDDTQRPFICQISGTNASCGSIDPSPFVDHDGTAYLYWKSDENSASCRTPPRVWVQRLSQDGLGLEGNAETILAKDRDWEGDIIEGPSVLMSAGKYFLFYSANWYASANYAVGYALCHTPTGPCNKVTLDEPWLRSTGDALGPGGQEVFADAQERTYLAYHAWSAPKTSYEQGGVRTLRFAPLDLTGGTPRLFDSRPSSTTAQGFGHGVIGAPRATPATAQR